MSKILSLISHMICKTLLIFCTIIQNIWGLTCNTISINKLLIYQTMRKIWSTIGNTLLKLWSIIRTTMRKIWSTTCNTLPKIWPQIRNTMLKLWSVIQCNLIRPCFRWLNTLSLLHKSPFFLRFTKKSSILCNFIMLMAKSNKPPEDFFERLFIFINIWSPPQWISSLGSLVCLYWWVGIFYNKKFSRWGGWLSPRSRILMIGLDIGFNLCIGWYYMGYRDTVLGAFMLKCPVAISPFIFLAEFIIVIICYQYKIRKEKKD